MLDLLFGALFFGATAPVIFPEETELVKKAYKLTREKRSAFARSTNNTTIKACLSQNEARLNRSHLTIGETIYFPNGATVKVEAGLKDVQMDNWWYAWDAEEK